MSEPLAIDGPILDRRGFVTTAAAAAITALLTSACGGGGDVSGPSTPGQNPGQNPGQTPGTPVQNPAGVERMGSSVRIDLSQVAALRQTNGFLIIASSPPVIVLRLSETEFRAFTAVCTHSGCLVSNFSANRINCACHGSQFDTRGQVVRGPASRELVAYPVSFNAAEQQLIVTA